MCTEVEHSKIGNIAVFFIVHIFQFHISFHAFKYIFSLYEHLQLVKPLITQQILKNILQ